MAHLPVYASGCGVTACLHDRIFAARKWTAGVNSDSTLKIFNGEKF